MACWIELVSFEALYDALVLFLPNVVGDLSYAEGFSSICFLMCVVLIFD